VNPERFRSLFPALQKAVWLDTPASPPGAQPVVAALTSALERWLSGTFSWSEWEAEAAASRELFASYLGVPRSTVALMSSFAEAAATVAACLPPGRIVVGDEEYRDNLFPWVALHDVGHEVVRVRSAGGGVRTEDLIAAVRPGTVLVAVSEVLSCDGARADLPGLRAASDEVGARLFVDVTQSLGVLRFEFQQVLPDYLAVHGYKWLLSPRGAAYLVAREDRIEELRPLLPSWKSTAEPAFFGGELRYASTAARCDTPSAWFSWIGARAALTLASELPRDEVERHCLELAARFRAGACAVGAEPMDDGAASHIVAARVPDAAAVMRAFERAGIRALALGDRVRVGFHYFNSETDVDAALAALRDGMGVGRPAPRSRQPL
jgi:selenocysteine lyase/cysteine desulfurase